MFHKNIDTTYDTIYYLKEYIERWSEMRLKVQKVRMMKMTIEEYINLPYRIEFIPDADEGGYAVRFPELPGCLSAGETLEKAYLNAMDAKRAWLEAAMKENIQIPMPDSDNVYSGQFKLRLPKSLHRTLAEHSKNEGVSMNQYCVYLLSRNDALYANQSK